MAASSRDRRWERVRGVEDWQGLVALVEDRLGAIRAQAWNEGSWDRVYADVTKAIEELGTLKDLLSERWEELMGEAK